MRKYMIVSCVMGVEFTREREKCGKEQTCIFIADVQRVP